MTNKYINLNSKDRFVNTDVLRSSYLHYDESLNPTADPFISFYEEDLELAIVSSQQPEVAKAVSSILTCSLEDAKDINGGHLPPQVVERVQSEIISPFGVSQLWGTTGHRFILSRSAQSGMREIIASILVAKSKDTIFFLTGRYNNLQHSTMTKAVDLNQSSDGNPEHKWFNKFAFPSLEKFKPKYYHQIANFVVIKECRGQGYAKFLIENIKRWYSRDYILANKNGIEHSQYLLCGKGFWQIGDPPWLPKMKALDFYLRAGAESFFIDQEWDNLPIIQQGDKIISNIEYNTSFNLPNMYLKQHDFAVNENHLIDRIPEVIELSQNPKAKLQYFQVMYDFI